MQAHNQHEKQIHVSGKISIPSDWKRVKLGEIANLSAGGTPSTTVNEYWEGGTIPWLSSGEVKNNVITESAEKITESGLENSAAKIFSKGTILLAIAGQGLTRGRAALLAIDAATNQSIVGIVCNGKVHNIFLWYFLQNEYWRLRNISQGTNRGGLNLSLLNDYDIILPTLPEQQKIASILSKVDDLIEKTDEIIEQTQRLRKGLMQGLLTKGIRYTRFKEIEVGKIPSDWQCVKLGDVTIDLLGGGTPSTTNPDFWGGSIPWTRGAVVNTRYVTKGEKMITKQGLENSATSLVPKDNLLIASRVSIGNIGINKIDIAISQDLTGIIVDKKRVDVEYLYWYLLKSKQIIASLAQGSTIKGITKEDIKNIDLLLPTLSEQKRIASLLSSVDEFIGLEIKKNAIFQLLKKSLMQKLLTGQLRVKV